MVSSPESSSTTLRMIDFFTIPKTNGDCVVLLLYHPGLNILGRYFPPAKVNNLLFGDISRARPSSSHRDIFMSGVEEPYMMEEMEAIEQAAKDAAKVDASNPMLPARTIILANDRDSLRALGLCMVGGQKKPFIE